MAGGPSDYVEIRSGDPAPPASSEAGGVRLYAAGDGSLRTIQSDGTDAAVGGGGSFNGGTITQRLEVDAAQDANGVLKVHETGVTGGLFGLLVTDPGGNIYIATTRTSGGFNVLLLNGRPIEGGLNIWSDFDNDGTAGLSVDNTHNVNVGASPGDGGAVGFYGHTPTTQQTGVGVDAASIHAALVNLGLITS